MKNSLFKIALLAIVSGLFLSSCLGDSKNSFEGSDRFAVIHQNSAYLTRYAIVEGYYGPMMISSPEIDKLTVGGCYFISYKIDDLNGASNSIYPATITSTRSIKSRPYHLATPPAEDSDRALLKSLAVICPGQMGDVLGENYNYNWIIKYNCDLTDELAVADVYFDKSRQVDENGKDLEKNQLILDIRFKKVENQSSVQTIGETFVTVNLADIANGLDFEPDFTNAGNDNYVFAMVKFRYKYVDKNVDKEKLYGTWDSPLTNSTSLYFTFVKDKN